MSDYQDARGLPDELLSMVISFLWPDSIVAFAQSCHRFHRLAQERLAEHDARHEAYRRVVISSRILDYLPDDIKQYDTLMELLAEMDEDPQLLYYINLLEVEGCDQEYIDEHLSDFDTTFRRLFNLSFVHNVAYKEQCMAGVARGDLDDCLMLVIDLATELTHLRTYGPTYSKQLISSVSDHEHAVQAVPSGSKLRFIEAFSTESDRRDISWFIHWTRLPRLETLSFGQNVHGLQMDKLYEWPPGPRLQLRNLNLFGSHSDGNGLAVILAGLRSIRSFTYTTSYLTTWYPSVALQALQGAALDTLECLTLYLPRCHGDPLTSLKPFKNLRHFRGSLDILPYSVTTVRNGIRVIDLSIAFPPSLTHLELAASRQRTTWDPTPQQEQREANIARRATIVSLINFEGHGLKRVAVAACSLEQYTLEALLARNVSVEVDWKPIWGMNSVYDGVLPEEWKHDIFWEPAGRSYGAPPDRPSWYQEEY